MWAFSRRSESGRRARLRWRPALPLIVYVAVNAASVLVASDKTLASWELALLGQTLLLFIYIVSTIRTREEVHFLVAVAMAALLLESALILWIYVFGTDPSFLGLRNRVDPSLYNGRIGGTVGSPNDAAAYLCLMLPLAIGVLMSSASTALRRMALIATPMGIAALAITGSRGGWISFAISSAILAIWALRKGLIKTRVVVLVVLTVFALLIPFWGTINGRLTSNDNGSAASRITLIRLATHMIRAHPLLGVGINNVGIDIPQYAGPDFDGQWLYTIHNKYLLVWAEAGIGALLAFLWFLAVTLRRGWLAAKAGDRLLSPLAVGLSAGIAGQLAHMGVDIFQSRPQVEGLWLAAALLAAMALIIRGPREGRRWLR
jgi:O-antigen ligase